jgi:hypothetical protein
MDTARLGVRARARRALRWSGPGNGRDQHLDDEPVTVDLGPDLGEPDRVIEVFANRRYGTRPTTVSSLEADGWGYRWLQLC